MAAIVIITTTATDGALKFFSIKNFSDGHSLHLFPFVDFVLHRNPGITGDIPVPMWIIAPITLGVILFLVDRVSNRSSFCGIHHRPCRCTQRNRRHRGSNKQSL